MKKFLAILAVLAALTFVGCDKANNDNKFVLEGQWLSTEIVGDGVVTQMGYDIGATRPGEIILFGYVLESDSEQWSVGSCYEMMSGTYTKSHDPYGNVTGFAIKVVVEEDEEPQYIPVTIKELLNEDAMVVADGTTSLTFIRISPKKLLPMPTTGK